LQIPVQLKTTEIFFELIGWWTHNVTSFATLLHAFTIRKLKEESRSQFCWTTENRNR